MEDLLPLLFEVSQNINLKNIQLIKESKTKGNNYFWG